jgi:hypothetical protein
MNIHDKLEQLKTLSLSQSLARHNLSKYDFRNKKEIADYLIREWQKKRGHIFIKGN